MSLIRCVKKTKKKNIEFLKANHIGNDFIIIDFTNRGVDEFDSIFTSAMVKKICDRNFGVGADGVIGVLPPALPGFDFRMHIINADGSPALMCGNGLACMAMFIDKKKLSKKKKLNIETFSGLRVPYVERSDDGTYKVIIDMGKPELAVGRTLLNLKLNRGLKTVVMHPYSFDGAEFKINVVSMGNPHCVIFLEKKISRSDFERLGPIIECHSIFPRKTNVEFVTIASKEEINVDVWERGAGRTLACGTGAAASAYMAYFNEFCGREVKVNLPGGTLYSEIKKDGNVFLQCRPVEVFSGNFDIF